ncbi:MAG TPA: NUDIX domain-containing protein [Chitinophaga sp.]|uniref:NUDIX domain-containing protein n=1 Tax=Chitinophaga sp. TaxID=1869181 RepID=UPI002C970129|nr:NUDIX domain-containing protein [Chitinophaga sp.]HVI48443.1 NUDIX domain-containing protein [Chitinophaga sp.]
MTDKQSNSPDQEETGITVRVYGIMIHESGKILVCDEYYYGRLFTKFPGGGMQLGESTRDCLIREWHEELDQYIIIVEHVYTSDIIQNYPFRNDVQVISIYYLVKPLTALQVPVSDTPFDFDPADDLPHRISLRWIDFRSFSANCMTLPADRIAASVIIAQIDSNMDRY